MLSGIRRSTYTALINFGIHVLFWTIYLLVMSVWRHLYFNLAFMLVIIDWLKILPIIMGITYLTIYTLIPNYRRFKRKWYLLIIVYGLIILCAPIQEYILTGRFFTRFLLGMIIENSFVVNIAAGLVLINRWDKTTSEKQEIAQEKEKAELTALESTISPHFLFNSMNSIYSLILKNENDQSALALEKLSDLLRKVLYESQNSIITLRKELDLIENYISLQRIRFEDRVEINMSFKNYDETFKIPKMIFFGFVENCFKHSGSKAGVKRVIDIQLYTKADQLVFKTYNSISENYKPNIVGGLGIKNTIQRLKLIYNEDFSFQIKNNNNTYEVELIIDITKDVENKLLDY